MTTQTKKQTNKQTNKQAKQQRSKQKTTNRNKLCNKEMCIFIVLIQVNGKTMMKFAAACVKPMKFFNSEIFAKVFIQRRYHGSRFSFLFPHFL